MDASALVEALILSGVGRRVLDRIAEMRGELHGPALVDVEASHVLRRFVQRGIVTAHSASVALDALVTFPLERWDHRPLLTRAWALRHNFSSYDAIYIALAESLDAPLLTLDGGMARTDLHRAAVELIMTH